MTLTDESKIGGINSSCVGKNYSVEMTGSTEILDNSPNGKFLCGVVEGFYGIPWTTEQRKLLFQWMNAMGMTTYMYAPKDDAKHRAFWRELYSVEEADNLTSLIEAATENNVTFVYAISPGLDISFSSAKDVQCLKRKLEQVSAFGCRAFALLFDDIDPELSICDKSAFQSSACAQVSITNEVFEHLGQPEFYFCPTEYCTSRAMPTLATSGYLNTVGSKLLNDVHILWTGSKVISKKITITELEEVAKVLRRPPVIWDNIHANDYDQRRLFLGPYDGRNTEIIPYLRGVLTNPNCEFEANYIPLHTLAQWSKSNKNAVKKDIINENRMSPVMSDIKLESECDDDMTCFDAKYQPRVALKKAIDDWLIEFNTSRHPPKSVAVATTSVPPTPVEPLPNLNMQVPPVVPPYSEIETTNVPTTAVNNVNNPSFVNPTTTVLVNSLVDPLCSPEGSPVRERLDSDSESDISLNAEPMDCVPSAITDSLNVLDSDLPKDLSSDTLMQVESTSCHCDTKDQPKHAEHAHHHHHTPSTESSLITYEDVNLLISFFYLPFEYASIPCQLLQDLHYLKVNSHVVACANKENPALVAEWWEVSDRFLKTVDQLQNMLKLLKEVPNQAVGYYFYPYLWDMLGVLQTCAGFVRWLGIGQLSNPNLARLQGPYTWMTKDYQDTFLSGDQEPWCFQGGLQAEFQRMLPIATAYDLLYIRHPDQILRKAYTYRPYKSSDEATVYDICAKTCDDGMDGSEVFRETPHVIADKLIGGLVTLSPEYSFVVEDEEGVMGYTVACLDARSLGQRQQLAWTPAMQEKYNKPPGNRELTPAEEIMASFHADGSEKPECVLKMFPAALRLDVLSGRLEDLAVTKRLLATTLSALKANGAAGVHVELSTRDKCMMEHYKLLGFQPVKTSAETVDDDVVFLGRLL